jgi:hypothetical protein
MKIETTKEEIEFQYPNLLTSIKWAGNKEKAKYFIDFAMAINENHFSLIETEHKNDEYEYYQENLKRGNLFLTLLLQDGKKRKIISLKEYKNLGLPKAFQRIFLKEPAKENFIIKTPEWSVNFNQPFWQEHNVIASFIYNDEKFIVSKNNSQNDEELEIFQVDGPMIRLHKDFLDEPIINMQTKKITINKLQLKIETDPEKIKTILNNNIIFDFDNSTKTLKINHIINQLMKMGDGGFFGHQERPEKLELFDHSKLQNVITVPWNKNPDVVFSKLGQTSHIEKQKPIMLFGDLIKSIDAQQQNVIHSEKTKEQFLLNPQQKKIKP